MKKPLCLNCSKRLAQLIPPYGIMPCTVCIKKQRKYQVKETIEVTTSEIKESRKEYSEDILQRFRGDTANKRYIKKYGTKGFTKEQIRNAKDVYPGFYKDD